MFGFGGSGSVGADSKEGDRSLSGTSSAASAAGKAASAASAAANAASNASRAASAAASAAGRASSSSGREGTTSGPGNPSAGRSTSSNAGREGTTSGPGNPSAGGGTASKGGRVGGGSGSVGADSKEGDRSLSSTAGTRGFGWSGIGTPAGWNGTSSPGAHIASHPSAMGFGAAVSDHGIDGFQRTWSADPNMRTAPSLGGISANLAAAGLTEDRLTRDPATRGFSYATAFGDDREIDRSLDTPSFQSFRSTDLAEMRRAQEDKSMDTYRDMVAANTQRQIGQYQTAQDNMLAVGIGDVGGKLGITDAFIGPIVDRMIGVESTNNPKAKNPISSALGLGQFIKSTWVGMIDKYRPDLASLTKEEKLALRTDPALSREMTTNYAIENAVHLAKNGINVNASSVYAAHFLGPDGAVKAYKANPQSSALSVLGSKAVNSNKNIMQGRTIGQVLGYIDKHMTMDAPKTITNHPIAGTFASKYLGGSQPGPEFGRVGTITGVSPEDAYLGPQSGISDDESGKNIAMWEQRQKEAAVPGGTEVTTTSPGTDAGAPPVKERSIAGSLIGGGVDVLTSLNPLTAGVNLLTQMVTGKSLGDHIADGDNQYDGTIKGDSGSRGDRNAPKQAEIKKPGSTVKSATFADKYLDDTGFSDPVKRPTPAEKWGDGSTYASKEYA